VWYKFSILIFILLLQFANADHQIDSIFQSLHLQGTFLLEDLESEYRYVYNDNRANTLLLPASTFKIPNTLIALEEKLMDANTLFKWDGVERSISNWNQDLSVQQAFQFSSVPVYQELAKKIGVQKYTFYLESMDYGNKIIHYDSSGFWLHGDFGITPKQQVLFLRKLIRRELLFSKYAYDVLKSIMAISVGTTTIYAKTGWATSAIEPHGWFVGYVEVGNKTWIFVCNILTPDASFLPLRQEVTFKVLKAKGILP
jgi:beta-lactamase class D